MLTEDSWTSERLAASDAATNCVRTKTQFVTTDSFSMLSTTKAEAKALQLGFSELRLVETKRWISGFLSSKSRGFKRRKLLALALTP